MDIVAKAQVFATAAHEAVGQKRKYTNSPYWKHPQAVARIVKSVDHTERMLATAWLHDVVEDTNWTLQGLVEAGFSQRIVDAIDCLTRRQNESYEQFLIRIKPNSLACKVKLADIEDNMDIKR